MIDAESQAHNKDPFQEPFNLLRLLFVQPLQMSNPFDRFVRTCTVERTGGIVGYFVGDLDGELERKHDRWTQMRLAVKVSAAGGGHGDGSIKDEEIAKPPTYVYMRDFLLHYQAFCIANGFDASATRNEVPLAASCARALLSFAACSAVLPTHHLEHAHAGRGVPR